jgi:cyclic pyranopterin phosphate synthase
MAALKQVSPSGKTRMIDVGAKAVTKREARAFARVEMKPETLSLITGNRIEKGNVLEVARLAGILAAKKTSEIIPLCHPLNIEVVEVDVQPKEKTASLEINTLVRLLGKTGAEMEALTAASAAALTVYDMCKSVDKEMVISDIKLIMKSGGRSGLYRRKGK